jgi:hypothetical protein
MSKLISDSKRLRILEKTEGQCAYCGCALNDSNRHFDHIVPQCKGGTNKDENLFAACGFCNKSKGIQTLEDFRLKRICSKAVSEAGFNINQLRWLEAHGLIQEVASDPDHKFFFERLELSNEY